MSVERAKKRQERRQVLKRAFTLFLVLWIGFTFCVPSGADAMTLGKLTVQPNGDKGNEVLGGKTTRITWEGYPSDDEVVTSVSLTLPEDVTFTYEDAVAMMLTGAGNLERVELDASFSAEGQTITATFGAPRAAEGGYLRFIIYNVVFPREGGSMQLRGSYTIQDGTTVDLGILPELNITPVTWAQAASSNLEEKEWVQNWNSVTFLNLFLNPAIAVRALPSVFKGFLKAIAVVALAFPCAIPIGLLLALMRISNVGIFRALASLYVNVVRGTPLFLQIYIVFFGLPLAGINMPYYVMAVIVLSLNSGAYLCEIFRAGIQSISKGQHEASRSLGMNGFQTMFFVIIPQTVRRVLPTMTSEFILLYKDTSLLASVGFMEIIMFAKSIVSTTGSITPYIVAACFYLLITLPLTKLVGNLEARLAGTGTTSTTKTRKRKSMNAIDIPEDEAAARIESTVANLANPDTGSMDGLSTTRLSSM